MERLIEVDLSFGEHAIRRPKLKGWMMILGSLPNEDWDRIFDAVLMCINNPEKAPIPAVPAEESKAVEVVEEADRIPDILKQAIRSIMEIIPRVPLLAGAIIAASVVDREHGKPVLRNEQEAMEAADDADLQEVLAVMMESGMLYDMVNRFRDPFVRRMKIVQQNTEKLKLLMEDASPGESQMEAQ